MICLPPRPAAIPFPPDDRASGILLHVTSVPSPYGIGGLGPAVTRWVDRLAAAGQRWWQCLPLGPTGYGDSPYHPVPNYAVAFTGTHDNDTSRGWYATLPENQRQVLRAYLRAPTIDESEIAPELLRLAWTSPAALAMAPLQDVLNLGGEARMNVPGRADGNWCWRCRDDQLGGPAFERLHDLTAESNRLAAAASTRSLEPELART